MGVCPVRCFDAAGNSLMVARRTRFLSKMDRLLWIRRAGGMYKENASEGKLLRTARSRIRMVAMTLNISWCGMARMVFCNCHLHRLTADKSNGFAETHDRLWNELASHNLGAPSAHLGWECQYAFVNRGAGYAAAGCANHPRRCIRVGGAWFERGQV